MMNTIMFFILIFVSSSHQLTGPKEVRGEVGGSVTVDCRYDQKYNEHKKQWSKQLKDQLKCQPQNKNATELHLKMGQKIH
ncbi:CMRF35-like molecule 5 isoform X2 [Chiloscyllium plagiosum]|uniref:CMRF35-like molecule 5 isoform X2 n=1 Tax=Chiloscyllium plagiosum TaxID=36176 RepID=UPI001CB7D95F|nr:CMRF35-like molecule 5 isoform X2 [Chiloscyllium plagiosum]